SVPSATFPRSNETRCCHFAHIGRNAFTHGRYVTKAHNALAACRSRLATLRRNTSSLSRNVAGVDITTRGSPGSENGKHRTADPLKYAAAPSPTHVADV